MIYPDFIKKGDTIAVTAPSEGNSDELDYIRLGRAAGKLEACGFKVIETPDVRTCINGRSADAVTRAAEFHEVWNNPAVKAVIAAKGGDFLMEMLPYIDFEQLKKSPKWFQGYSDNTSIAFLLTTLCDMASIYCNNFNDFAMEEWHESIKNNVAILGGDVITQKAYDMYQDCFYSGIDGTEGYKLTTPVEWKRVDVSKGNGQHNQFMEGRLLGGCLDVLLNLAGTGFDKVREFVKKYADDGILWFMESFSLDGCSIERGLWQLGEAGWFANAKGFMFGRPAIYDKKGWPDYSEAVLSQLKKYNVPVIIDADIGHRPPQFTMINGAKCRIDYSNDVLDMFLV